MITPADLSSRSRQDLVELAKNSGIVDWRGMKKEDLVAALRNQKVKPAAKAKTPAPAAKKAVANKKAAPPAASKTTALSKTTVQAKTAAQSKRPAQAAVTAKSAASAPSSRSKPKTSAPLSGKAAKATAASKLAPPKSSKSNPPAKPAVANRGRATSTAVVGTRPASASKQPSVKANGSAKTNGQANTNGSAKANRPAQANVVQASRSGRAGATKSSTAAASTGASRSVKSLQAVSSSSASEPSASSVVRKAALATAVTAKNPVPATRTAAKTAAVAVAKKPAVAVAPPAPVSAKSARIRREMAQRSQRALQNKDISSDVLIAGSPIRTGHGAAGAGAHKDRVVLLVRDCFWLQAEWEITRAAVDRIRVAMAEKWHAAIPVLRLMSVADASANRAEQTIRDIPIHGGVSSWYIDVDEPPSRFRVVVGYVADNDRFFPICRSNVVETPRPGAANRIDEHWRDIAEDYERIYSLSGGLDASGSGDDLKDLFEDRLKRSMPSRSDASNAGSDTDAALDRHRALPFEVDAELIIYGSTIPGATVMLGGEPVKLRPDGSFTIRVALPDKRQVFPVVAQSRDGMRQRTTVVAVERNTKVMEAVDRDSNF